MPAKFFLSLAERFLGMLALSNVPRGPGNKLHLAVRPEHGRKDVFVNSKNSRARSFERNFTFDRLLRLDHLCDLTHVPVVMPLFITEFPAGFAGDIRELHAPNF